MSPVIRADSKFFGTPPHLCVDVRFASTAELDALIQTLTRLRDQPPGGFTHVHLQDHGLGQSAVQTVAAEVTFWHPSTPREESDRECVAHAADFLATSTYTRVA